METKAETDSQSPRAHVPVASKKPSPKSLLWLLLKVTISTVLLGYLFYQTDQEDLFGYIKSVPWWFILLAWFYYAVCQWVSAYRWQMFLSVKHIQVPLKSLFSFYMVGMFLNNFLPGAVGGDVVKAADLYRLTKQGNFAISSVFLERFTGLVGLTIIGVFATILCFRSIESLVVMASVVCTALFLFSVTLVLWCEPLMLWVIRISDWLLPAVVGKKFASLYEALHSYKQHPKVMYKAVALSVVLQLMFALYYGLFAWQLGIDVDLAYFVLFLPAITLITMLPLSIGGLGVREALMVVLFAQVGVGSAEILSISLTVHVVNIGLSLFGGLIFALRKPVTHQVSSTLNQAPS
jgi:glycosyltransferase 2 family protein